MSSARRAPEPIRYFWLKIENKECFGKDFPLRVQPRGHFDRFRLFRPSNQGVFEPSTPADDFPYFLSDFDPRFWLDPFLGPQGSAFNPWEVKSPKFRL